MKQLTLLLFMLFLLIFSCQRIEQNQFVKGELQCIMLENIDGIPSEFGTLTAVTTHGEYGGWSQLWFVDSSNTIHMVRVQFHENRINKSVLVIPRN